MSQFPYLENLFKSNISNNSITKEEKLRGWAKPPSEAEIEKCERAERMIKQAIEDDPKLSKMNISVYAKGSYANRTNIPSESDVDVAVVADDYYFNTYPDGMTYSDFGYVISAYSYINFKNDIESALKRKFGSTEVVSGEKCITVRSNSCRVDADIVPHFTHKRFSSDRTSFTGVALKKLDGTNIFNWPVQDYNNGVSKNEDTGRRYKALVRILKNIKTEMNASGIKSAENAPSYLISCLVWNIPNYYFKDDSYEKMTSDVLDFLIERTTDMANVKEWVEVNELKYLFRASQPWKMDEVNQFLNDAKMFLKQV